MSKTVTFEVTLKNKLGLHARPAAIFVKTATKFESDITVEKNGEEVNGKSLIGLLMLAAEYHSKLRISAKGTDAETAAKTLETLVNNDKDFLEE